jgi:fluoroquinolone resistance protein
MKNGSVFEEDKVFEKEDFSQNPLPKGDYDYCTFIGCNFADGDLSEVRFLECEFKECNLNTVKLGKTIFRDVKFYNCKMMGFNIDEHSNISSSSIFKDCILSYSSFYGKAMKKIAFVFCKMQEVDFTACDLSGSSFDDCDLQDAKFEQTILEHCDLRKAFNYIIDPQKNKLKKAKFSLDGLPGLLYNYDIIIE